MNTSQTGSISYYINNQIFSLLPCFKLLDLEIDFSSLSFVYFPALIYALRYTYFRYNIDNPRWFYNVDGLDVKLETVRSSVLGFL